MRKRLLVAGLAALCALAAPACARAQALPLPPVPGVGSGPQPAPYRSDDYGGFLNVLPPGEAGLDNAAQLGQFEATGARPPHADDQVAMYRDLLYGYPSLTADDLTKYYKDASFGVKPGDAESTYSPRSDVTIVRDRFDVPHVYGSTRAGAEFGLGYVTAEDRLFFIDVFRHLGRGQLSSFAGGDPSNRALDAQIWNTAPYTEEDLQRQVDARPPGYEQQADQLRQDVTNYTAGVNQYIAESRLDPLKMPAEYAAIGQPQGPADWKPTDVVATADVVGAIFGAGGGRELPAALALEEMRARFGRKAGNRVFRDFRDAQDPEAPTTVRGRRFPYMAEPRRPRGTALPDPGSVHELNTLDPSTAKRHVEATPAGSALLAFPEATSNALLVSARRSQSGRPLAVFGPQVAYFSPEIVMEQDVHAPGLDARGVAFPGTNLYVQLGRGRDYAWSATSAGQDITDTFALPLCGDAMHYRFRGQCLPIEVLQRTNSWQPNAADPTPAGTQTLTAERTALGIVTGRATIKGKPVIYTRLRTTYRHETDSALGFSYFNDPGQVHDAASFQRAASLIGYTFNWFYVDDRNIAYFNSGFDPVRAPRVETTLPVWGTNEWRRYDPASNTPEYLPASTHPQSIDQDWMTSWNNKQALGVSSSDANWAYGPTYRSVMLDQGVKRALAHGRKMNLVQLVKAMEDAATVDLRGDAVLPWVLRVAGHPHDRTLGAALNRLAAWKQSGAHRVDRNRDGAYDDADAVRLMDAWWPLLLHAEFQPVLGRRAFDAIAGMNELSNDPNNHGDHLGSAYQHGWYGYVIKDLRTLLHPRRVHGRFSRVYCGHGKLRRCRAALLASLRKALTVSNDQLYNGDKTCTKAGRAHDQACYDDIYFRPLGAITQDLLPWQNRPTFQQVVEVQGHRPR